MDRDEDIARMLPEPPPPRPARRDAAIGAAMRRFDGLEDLAPAATPQRPRAWPRLGRVQIGALASVALVALVGVPAALVSLKQQPPIPVSPSPAPATSTLATPLPAGSGSVAKSASQTPPASTATAANAPRERGQAPAEVAESGQGATPTFAAKAISTPVVSAPPPSPPPPPPPAPAPQAAPPSALADKDMVVTGSQLRRAAPVGTNAVTAAKEEDRDAENIIVTGTKTRGRAAAAARRGDWNACTVNDPGQSLAGCKRLVNPGAKGPAGVAAAHLAEGLSRAWDGDTTAAIAAFDQALALQPRLAFAYLNRGLIYQRQGDFDRALADFDRAVRFAPGEARGYYNRAQLLREHGLTRRADSDEERAVELDPDYEALVK